MVMEQLMKMFQNCAIAWSGAIVQFTEDLKFTCDICSKLFTRKSTLDEHKHIVHGNPATKHKCQYCSKEFNKLFNAKRHEKQCQKHEELEEQGKN